MYGEEGKHFEAGEVKPLSAVVPVDVPIYGCPINGDEFLAVMKSVLLGQPYRVPNQPVCYECKLNQYECVLDRGQVCLGPVTRCGCNAICTSRGHRCFGCRGRIGEGGFHWDICRGLVDDPNLNAARDVLSEHGYTLEDMLGMFEIYSLRSSPAEKLKATAAEDEAETGKGEEPWRFGSST